MNWYALLALAAVCAVMRIVVPLGLGERRPAWLDRALDGAIPGLLAAFVATAGATDGRHLQADPRLGGLGAAALAIVLRAPPVAVLLAAVVVTAALRAV